MLSFKFKLVLHIPLIIDSEKPIRLCLPIYYTRKNSLSKLYIFTSKPCACRKRTHGEICLPPSRCSGMAFCHIIYSLEFWVTNSILCLSLGWEWSGQSPAGRSLETRDSLWLHPLSVWQDRSGAALGPPAGKKQEPKLPLHSCLNMAIHWKKTKGGVDLEGLKRLGKRERDMLREIH